MKWGSQDAGSKKGKKRARGFEGDEVFKSGPEVLCKSVEEESMVLAVLNGMCLILIIPSVVTDYAQVYLLYSGSQVFLRILSQLHQERSCQSYWLCQSNPRLSFRTT